MLEAHELQQYYGGSHTLRGTSISVPDACCICVMGRNGVGKTTLLRAIMGLVAVRSGSVRFGGRELLGTDASERARAGIGYVPQGREIFPELTVEENLRIGPLARHARYDGKRDGRDIPDLVFRLFPVLRTMMRRRGGNLSGGQQQQLAIARALTLRPTCVLLDEPTEGIQPSIIKDIGRVIELLRSRGTMAILLVEQYYEFARELADTLAVMDRGDIVLSGAPGTLDEADVRRRLSV